MQVTNIAHAFCKYYIGILFLDEEYQAKFLFLYLIDDYLSFSTFETDRATALRLLNGVVHFPYNSLWVFRFLDGIPYFVIRENHGPWEKIDMKSYRFGHLHGHCRVKSNLDSILDRQIN